MSGAVYLALAEDEELESLGVEKVFFDYSMEECPREDIFLIVRWGQKNITRGIRSGPQTMTVWVHQPKEWGTDYSTINKILYRCRDILEDMIQVSGPDDVQVSQIIFMGESGNLIDGGFDTITKNATYQVLHHSMV